MSRRIATSLFVDRDGMVARRCDRRQDRRELDHADVCNIGRCGLAIIIRALVILHRQRAARILKDKGEACRRHVTTAESLHEAELDVGLGSPRILHCSGGEQRETAAYGATAATEKGGRWHRCFASGDERHSAPSSKMPRRLLSGPRAPRVRRVPGHRGSDGPLYANQVSQVPISSSALLRALPPAVTA